MERLSRLELLLVARGFDDPVARIQFHLRILKRLRRTPGINSDETLWSLVEATELANIYCTVPCSAMSPKTFRDKFRAILAGPQSPHQETAQSNLARNTVFELYLAGWLSFNGIPTKICHNPDIACTAADRQIFLQCKRPFSGKGVAQNIKKACKQFSRDLDDGGDTRNRGVVAISLTHAVNPGGKYLKVRREADLTTALERAVRSITDHQLHLINGPRIVGLVFGVTTAAFVEDANEYRTGDLMVVYPSNSASVADRAMLRHVFLRKRAGDEPREVTPQCA